MIGSMTRRTAIAGLLASSPPLAAAARVRTAPLRLRFASDWAAQAEHGGFYQAVGRGFYAEAGLDVEIIQGSPDVNIPLILAGGGVEAALAGDSFTAINASLAGVPALAIMAIFQKDPQILMSHPRDDLPDLRAMRGKPIRVASAAVAGYWQWLKSAYGFSDDQIRPYDFTMAPFLRNPEAIQEGYITSEPYLIERASGIKPKIFRLSDYGYAGYGAVAMVGNDFAAAHPKAVTAFVAATQRGWREFLYGDSRPGRRLIRRANPLMEEDVMEASIAAMRRYRLTESPDTARDGFGAMTHERWRNFRDQMVQAGVYEPGTIDLQRVYTTRYLREARG